MKYAIIADIHANLEALIEVKKELERNNIDKFICLGDIVGYGANPKECLKLSKKLFDIIIAGNHDWAVADKFDMSNFNTYAREAVKWTQKILSEQDKGFLQSLPLTMQVDDFAIVHGSPYHPGEFHYILSDEDARKAFSSMKSKICFVGHSHSPVVCSQDKRGELNYSTSDRAKLLLEDNKYIINVGSLGQPRDGNPKAAFCIFDDKDKMVEIKRISYPISIAQEKIIKAGLPHFLAIRLAGGR